MDAPAALSRFVPRWETLFLNLQTTPADVLTGANTAVAWALRALQNSQATHEVLANVLEEAVRHLEALPDTQQAQWRRAIYYLYLLVRHTRPKEEQDTLFQRMNETLEPRHQEEVNRMAMTGAQALEAKGRREGRREVALELITTKFGPLSDQTRAAVEALSETELNRLAVRILSATHLSDLGL